MKYVVALVALVIWAGCAQPPASTESPGGANLPEADDPDPPATSPEQTVSPTPRPRPTAPPPRGGEAESWFLHIERTCDDGDPFCNCGSTRNFMDLANETDDCDAHGNRPGSPTVTDAQFDLVESWPADEDGSSWPVGTHLDGVLYVTTDVQSTFDYFLRLEGDDGVVVETAVRQGTASDAGFGLRFTPMPFDGALVAPIEPGAGLRLELYIRWTAAATSYFIGYEDDHASWFSLSPPA